MTFIQLEYIIAIDIFKHFAKAAEHCFVTQPTLSMQVQKLEEELGVRIFDRSKQPVVTTEAGAEIIEQARKIVAEKNVIQEIIQAKQGTLSGELRIGIIPTLAPYLLPLFVKQFNKKYPRIKLIVQEMITSRVIGSLREGKIDAGIVVTPLKEAGIKEQVLFYEELVAYVSRKNKLWKQTVLLQEDIDPDKLWLLEEGHCFRSQILNLCELKKAVNHSFEYQAGSIETLRRMVDLNDGITILPELTTLDLSSRQRQMIRYFRKPAPMREVSIAVHRDFVKKRLIEVLKEEMLATVPEKIRNNKNRNIVPINLP